MRFGEVRPVLALGLFVSTTGILIGCTPSADKAGDTAPPKARVLTLAAHADDEEEWKPFADAVARLSHGKLQITVLQNWRGTGTTSEITAERGIVSDVRVGTVQLGVVGARVWDTLGIDSFQALLAPFLIDGVALEDRALQTSFAYRALAAVRRAGVVGVALLPGRLRRPLGVRRKLVGVHDYRGARIGIRPSRVAQLTLAALGAHAVEYIPGDLSAFDGAEIDPYTVMAENFDSYSRELTGNVVLWPKPWTFIMNPKVFAGLSPGEQQILLTAGRDAMQAEVTRVENDTRVAVSTLCAGRLRVAMASAADRAGLLRAVRPVYSRIEHDPFSRHWVAEIQRLKATAPPDVARCRTS